MTQLGASMQAIAWWRHLLGDLGSAPQTGDPGVLGEQARRRCGDLIELFFECSHDLGATTMLELGSYSAETSRRFVNSDPISRKAFACEASPRVYAQFREAHPEGGGVTYINKAIGETEGSISFNMPRDPTYVLWGSIAERTNFSDVDSQEVEMTTIDVLLSQHGARTHARTTVGWIDVEGLALDVLKGADRALRESIAALYIEVNDINLFPGKGSAYEVIDLLLSKDFVPIARDNEYSDAWNIFLIHRSCFELLRDKITKWMYTQQRIALDVHPT